VGANEPVCLWDYCRPVGVNEPVCLWDYCRPVGVNEPVCLWDYCRPVGVNEPVCPTDYCRRPGASEPVCPRDYCRLPGANELVCPRDYCRPAGANDHVDMNSLPFDIHNSCSIASFRRKLKTFYSSTSSHVYCPLTPTPAPQIRRVSRRHCALYKLSLLIYLLTCC